MSWVDLIHRTYNIIVSVTTGSIPPFLCHKQLTMQYHSEVYTQFTINIPSVLNMVILIQETISGVDSLPVCCDQTTANTDEKMVKLAASIYLKTIMDIAGQRLVPYNTSEVKGLSLNLFVI